MKKFPFRHIKYLIGNGRITAIRWLRYKSTTTARWFYYFDFLHISGLGLYDRIEEAIKCKEIPDIKICRITYPEHRPIFSAYRVYLRITWYKTVFEISAAPMGHSYFISYRKGRKAGLVQKLVPLVGGILERALIRKTYYQQDAEDALEQNILNVLQKVVRDCVDVRVKRGSIIPDQVISDIKHKHIQDLRQAVWVKGVKSKPYECDNRVY